ncbi:MAG TPA: nucleotidyltransferase domain-containing protein [Beijerinckiaceae bacterium]|jgi:hypothetical protein
MKINLLNGEERRQLINSQQTYSELRDVETEYRRRFQGSMRWAERDGDTYLLRKVSLSERSLGPRNDHTEAAYKAFMHGRAELAERRDGLKQRLEKLAPLNIAMGLGRVPNIAARILRKCDEKGLLGEQITVVGTNALFAYEARAGVRLSSELIATDFLLDTRRRLSLAVQDVREAGLIGLLRQADKTFVRSRQLYKAVNRNGYLVELIRPQPKDVLRDRSPARLTSVPEDLQGAAVIGLDWLISAPKMEATAIDDKGLPARLVVVDPRVFSLHKLWLSRREDRDPLKKHRDFEQAKAAATLAVQYFGLSFASHELDALPLALRNGVEELLAPNGKEGSDVLAHW